MAVVAYGWVHLCVGAELIVAVGRDQREVVRRHLDARPILVVGEKSHLCRRRHVQHVHAPLVLLGEAHEAPGGDDRGFLIAPFGVR